MPSTIHSTATQAAPSAHSVHYVHQSRPKDLIFSSPLSLRTSLPLHPERNISRESVLSAASFDSNVDADLSHRALIHRLRRILASFPITPPDTVVDVVAAADSNPDTHVPHHTRTMSGSTHWTADHTLLPLHVAQHREDIRRRGFEIALDRQSHILTH